MKAARRRQFCGKRGRKTFLDMCFPSSKEGLQSFFPSAQVHERDCLQLSRRSRECSFTKRPNMSKYGYEPIFHHIPSMPEPPEALGHLFQEARSLGLGDPARTPIVTVNASVSGNGEVVSSPPSTSSSSSCSWVFCMCFLVNIPGVARWS